jgi:putative two-component system response regulator
MKNILRVEYSEGRVGLARDVLRALGEVYERHGDPERALEYLQEEFNLNLEASRAQVALQKQFDEHPETARLYTDRFFARRRAALETSVRQRIDARTELAVMAGRLNGYDELHIFRRGRLAKLTATAAGWTAQEIRDAVVAAQLVDIGIIAVPEKILRRPRLLTVAERRLVNKHSAYGVELLSSAKLQALDTAAKVARHYKEHWDGGGFPDGLAGAAIPIEAQLVALCDVFEAMTHDRPWRRALQVSDALSEIESLAGSWFAPMLTRIFVRSVREALSNTEEWEAFLSEDAQSSGFVKTKHLLVRLTPS